MKAPLANRKRADVLSITGAAVAGAALGAWLHELLQPWIVPLLVGGLLLHGVGMTVRHRLDRMDGPLPRTWHWLYVVCWVAIAGLVAVVVMGSMGGVAGWRA